MDVGAGKRETTRVLCGLVQEHSLHPERRGLARLRSVHDESPPGRVTLRSGDHVSGEHPIRLPGPRGS